MRDFCLKGFLVLLAAALAGCGGPQQSGYRGNLLFGRGAYLMSFSLRDSSLSVIDNLGDKSIREISGLGPDRLLIAETASVNGRNVSRISWLDLKTGESAALFSGVMARYLSDDGVIVYDDGSSLYAVYQRGPVADEVIFSHRLNQVSAMTTAATDLLLFETDDEPKPTIRCWNAATGALQNLDALAAVCRLEGSVWIGTIERLACKNRDRAPADGDYLLANLAGEVDGKLSLPEHKQFLALAHLEGQDALILRETWRGLLGDQDKFAVWAYDIRTGESVRLAKSQNLGTSVVYREF
jgi:hypothetical protein